MKIEPEHISQENGKQDKQHVEQEDQPAGHIMSDQNHWCLYYPPKLALISE
jgi:hypothetical protein